MMQRTPRPPSRIRLVRALRRALGRVLDERRSIPLHEAARPHEMAALIEELGWDGRLRHVRDVEYLTWRYADPSSRYRFLYWEDPQLRGFLSLHQRSGRGHGRLAIADWEAADLDVRAALLAWAVRYAAALRVPLCVWTATLGEEGVRLLAELGFEPHTPPGALGRQRPTLLIRDLRRAEAKDAWSLAGKRLTDPASWDLRMLYSDAF